MMRSTEIILVTLGTFSVVAAVPQLITLLKRRKSDQFNLFSWLIWLSYQVASCVYSYSIRAYAYLFINVLWTIFYAVMVTTILKFRRPLKSSKLVN